MSVCAAHTVVLQYVKKDYAGAEQAYREAVSLDPQDAVAHKNLGILLLVCREKRKRNKSY